MPLSTTCECSDKGCRTHQGESHCHNQASELYFRVDMDDQTGTGFCDACASDACESGLFISGNDLADQEAQDYADSMESTERCVW
jgi:hypothetical protein